MSDSPHPETGQFDEDGDYVVLRGEFEYRIRAVPRLLPIAPFNPVDLLPIVLMAVYTFGLGALSSVFRLGTKLGVVRSKTDAGNARPAKVVHAERLDTDTDIKSRILEMAARVNSGAFDS